MDFNLSEVIRAVAHAVPTREALVHDDRRLTYAAFMARVDRLASALSNRGFGHHTNRAELQSWQSGQDHVALYLHNCPEYIEAMVGAYSARLAPFNVNYRYVAGELRYLLNDSGARVIIFHSAFAATLDAIRSELPELQLLLQVDDNSGAPLLDGAEWYEDVLASAPMTPLETPSPDDLYILYTGGTTGMPKGVLWRQGDIYPAALGGRKISTGVEYDSIESVIDNAVEGGMRVLPSAPFMHGAAHWMAINALGNGNTIVLPHNATTFDAADFCDTIKRENVNIAQIVGDAFGRPLLDELDRAPHDLSSLVLLISGGAALSAPVKSSLLERLPSMAIMDGLGSSETGQQASQVIGAGAQITTGTFKPGTGMAIVSAVVLNPDTKILAGWRNAGVCHSAISAMQKKPTARSQQSTASAIPSPEIGPESPPTEFWNFTAAIQSQSIPVAKRFSPRKLKPLSPTTQRFMTSLSPAVRRNAGGTKSSPSCS
jgi:fatty-acyl-CoA synthase